MASASLAAADGISIETRRDGTVFRVKQDRWGQLVSILKFLAFFLLGAVLSLLMLKSGLGGLALLGLIGTFVFQVAFIGFLIPLVVFLFTLHHRHAFSEFMVTPDAVLLTTGKPQWGYPESVARRDVHSLYIKAPNEVPRYSRDIYMVGTPGMLAAVGGGHLALAAVEETSRLTARRLGRKAWVLAMEVNGREILLSSLLTERRAAKLMEQVERALLA